MLSIITKLNVTEPETLIAPGNSSLPKMFYEIWITYLNEICHLFVASEMMNCSYQNEIWKSLLTVGLLQMLILY